LKSIMLEYSDLSAPKKAKGFHKLTLNEVQKSGQGHHKVSMASFHESDHARSWRQNTPDLEGLFQLPVTPRLLPAPMGTLGPDVHQHTPQQVLAAGQQPTNMAVFSPGTTVLLAPPAYNDVISGMPATLTDTAGNPGTPITHTPVGLGTPATHSVPPDHVSKRPLQLPDWCCHGEDQVPPVYKLVFEASLIDGKISTEHLYRILLLSGLAREKLAQIWSLCNTATPGQLTRNELWMVLALIALTQNNYGTNSLDILARCPVAPVPFFAQMQDTSAPATLPTTPHQHQAHSNHQPSLSSSTSHDPAHDAFSSTTPHLPQPLHRIQHPKASTHRTSLAPLGASNPRSVMAGEDDDFADFQAASPASRTTPVSVGKDEDYGEFIGGGGVGNASSSLSYPTCNHVGNGSVLMGTAQHQQQHQEQQEAQQQQPASLALTSLPVDDKYGTNVRSFFCSSDSSTGHTSPSFEDDDFTDGRDSLSQLSTSEQSENEDIRNFENYVEEYNQQKEKPSASPLHCPFPALQQSEAVLAVKKLETLPGQSPISGPTPVAIARSSAPDGRISRLDFGAVPPNRSQEHSRKHTGVGSHPLSESEHAGRLPPTPLKVTFPPSARVSREQDQSEFDDFKMATVKSPVDLPPPGDAPLIGDEDKYSALRVLNLDIDIAAASLFEGQGQTSEHSSKDSASRQEVTAELARDDDGWADFSAAPEDTSASTAAPGKETSVQQTLPSGSAFGSKVHNSTPALVKQWDMNPSGPGRDQIPLQGQTLDSLEVGWDKHQLGDWEVTASEIAVGCHQDAVGQPPGSPNNSSINQVSPSGLPVTAGFPKSSSVAASVRIDLDQMLAGDEGWGQFSQTASSLASGTSAGAFSQNTRGGDASDHKDLPSVDGHSTGDDDWCDFSGADSGGISAKVGTAVAGTDVTENVDSRGKFVTIKKQNLGTSEIMGLFKVRDDPAILSTYQLPQQQQQQHHHHHQHSSKTAASHGHGSVRTGGSNHGHRRSSDFDDDLGPPPMDFGHDDDYDDLAFSRGYDLDDFMQPPPPATTYSPFGVSHTSPLYSRAGGLSKLKDNKEDSGSVHSLDLPSVRPTNPSSSDSQSVSSADLVTGEMTGAGVVSAESKSVDSLDLKSDSADVDVGDGGSRAGAPVSEQASSKPHQPIQPQELLATMPDFADRYNIEREAQGSDRYGYEWERCLANCLKVISEANCLFNTINSSSVCNEILKSSQGCDYMTCVVEIYRVVCRVLTSMRVTAISTKELEQTLKHIHLAWNNLTAFLVGTSLLPDETSLTFSNCVLKSDWEDAQHLACGLCLLNVDARPPPAPAGPHPGSMLVTNSCKLTYAGRQYHATCANFWVNCVDQTLPSLTLPDLL
ncbi:unnamed protein product, partial [Candidula unifasciata]